MVTSCIGNSNARGQIIRAAAGRAVQPQDERIFLRGVVILGHKEPVRHRRAVRAVRAVIRSRDETIDS